MDKTKTSISLMQAWTALDRLEAALDQGDQRGAGVELLRLRQALENMQTSTGVKLEFVNLKPDPPQE